MKPTKPDLRLFLSIVVGVCCFAQLFAQSNTDSLYKVWTDKGSTNTAKMSAALELSRTLLYTETDSSRSLAEQMLKIAENDSNFQMMIDAHNTIGGTHWVNVAYVKALNHYKQALTLAIAAKDQKRTSSSYNNVGTIYDELGNYPKALENYEKSLTIKLNTGDKEGLASSYFNIGSIYAVINKNSEALDYFQKSLQIDQELNNQSGIAMSYSSLGTVQGKLGRIQEAHESFDKSLSIYKELKDDRGKANALNNLGSLYERNGDNEKALNYYTQCLKLQKQTNDQRGISISETNIGKIYTSKRNFTKAIQHCETSYDISEKQQLTQQQFNACECLYIAHKRKKNDGYALAYLERLMTLSDQLASDQTADMLQQLEYDQQLQMQEINYQNQRTADSLREAESTFRMQRAHEEKLNKTKNIRNIVLITAFIILLVAGGLFTQLRLVRKSRKIIQKERDRSDELLLNILPEEIASELKEKGHADAKNHDKVTILFTDFKEFTQTSEKLSATELVMEINACFEAFDKIMEKYHVEKIKTIGDAYMAAGGLPVPEEHSVINTVQAALEMQQFITNRKKLLDSEDRIAFEMRVGIHTGSAVAGIVGVKKFQYDIWGDTVNTASRMESSGEVGKVNISQSTYEIIKNNPKFEFISRGKIQAKNKGAIEMYFVSFTAGQEPSEIIQNTETETA